MQLSVFYHHIKEAASQSGKTVSETAKYVHSLGIDHVEFDIADLIHSDENYNIIRDAGMKISSIYAFYDFGKVPDTSFGYTHVDIAGKLGSEKIMIVPGFYSSIDKNIREKERENMLSAMSEICSYAAENGIVPTVEDFDDFNSPISTAEGMLWFIEKIPSLKATFDTGNFMYSAESELYAFEKLKDSIVHVHCKDRSMTPNPKCEAKVSISGTDMFPCPVGSGCVPIGEIVKSLERSGYKGIYAIEHFGAEDQLMYIERSVENLKEMASL